MKRTIMLLFVLLWIAACKPSEAKEALREDVVLLMPEAQETAPEEKAFASIRTQGGQWREQVLPTSEPVSPTPDLREETVLLSGPEDTPVPVPKAPLSLRFPGRFFSVWLSSISTMLRHWLNWAP